MALATGDFELHLTASVVETNGGVAVGARDLSFRHLVDVVQSIGNGTGASAQDIVFSERRSLVSPYQMDLSGGITSVVDASAQTMAVLTAIIIRNLSTTTGEYVTLGGGSGQIDTLFSGAGDSIVLGPGALFVATSFIDGWAVTDSTAEKLQLAAASYPTSVDILLIGRSA